MLGTWKGIALHKEVLLSHVFWHKYTKHYHFANVKFPGRKHTLHVNSCPDHSREQKTASSMSASPYSLNVPAKTWPKKNPTLSNPTAQFLHVHHCLFPTADPFKDFRAQSCLSEPYTSTGLDEFPTYCVLEQHNGFPGLPAEEPVRADWWMAAREPAVEYGTLCLVSTTAEVVGRVYSAGDTLGRKGVEKEQNDFQCLAFTLNPPLKVIASWKHTIAYKGLQFHTVLLVFHGHQWIFSLFFTQIAPLKAKWNPAQVQGL